MSEVSSATNDPVSSKSAGTSRVTAVAVAMEMAGDAADEVACTICFDPQAVTKRHAAIRRDFIERHIERLIERLIEHP